MSVEDSLNEYLDSRELAEFTYCYGGFDEMPSYEDDPWEYDKTWN